MFTDCVVTLEEPSTGLIGLNLNIGKAMQHSKEEQNLFLIWTWLLSSTTPAALTADLLATPEQEHFLPLLHFLMRSWSVYAWLSAKTKIYIYRENPQNQDCSEMITAALFRWSCFKSSFDRAASCQCSVWANFSLADSEGKQPCVTTDSLATVEDP